MRTTTALSITLPHKLARMVKDRVASGEYASESEVIREGLRALLAQEEAVEHWLRTEVVPRYEASVAGTDDPKPIDEAWAEIEAHMDEAERKAG